MKAATLQEDGKTVVLTVDKMTNQETNKLTVSEIVEKTVIEFKVFDASLPEITGVTFTGPKLFVVTANEPLDEKGTVTIKTANTTLSVASATINPNNPREIL